MKHQILFIHGAGEGAHALDSQLAASLQDALESDYLVKNPKMPKEGAPEYKLWKEEIARQLAAIDGNLILVGHSLGASVLLKYLAEEPIKIPIVGLFLIATPYWGAEGWDYDEYKLRANFAAHLPRNLPIFLYHSRDDEIVEFTHQALYADKLPQATVRQLATGGHQLNNDLSEVAADILALNQHSR